jgi:hypothetical protein
MFLAPSLFLESLIAFLVPYFTLTSVDRAAARIEIIETLASYATRTRAEMLQAAQIIALGMTTLDVLAEARTSEMSQSMRVRSRACANSLNRSTLSTEKALDRRLAYDLPATPEPMPERVNDISHPEAEGDIEQTRSAIGASRDCFSYAHPRSVANKMPTAAPGLLTPEERNERRWAGAMVDTLRRMGMPDESPPAR